MKRPFEHFAAWRLTPRAPASRKRLNTLYVNYFDGWRARFGVPSTVAEPTSIEELEHRSEGEGDRPGEEASKP